MCNKFNIIFGGPFDEAGVFVGEGGHLQINARDVDAFAVFDFAAVGDLADELVVFFILDGEVDFAVVDE